MFKDLCIIIGLLFLLSCSSASKLRKAEKLIKQAEEMGATWTVDTVKVEIPVLVPEIVVRETISAPVFDTVRIEYDRLKIKLVKLPGDSIFVEGKCESDTVRIEVPVTVTKTIESKSKGYSLWQLIVLALVMLLAGYGIRAFMRR